MISGAAAQGQIADHKRRARPIVHPRGQVPLLREGVHELVRPLQLRIVAPKELELRVQVARVVLSSEHPREKQSVQRGGSSPTYLDRGCAEQQPGALLQREHGCGALPLGVPEEV